MSKELAADYFSRHESSNECHITSDARVFHTKGAADSFANGLKDNKVESFTRDQFEVNNIDVVDDIEETGDETDEEKAIALNESLKAFDSQNATYEDAFALAKALELKLASKSKVDVFAALELEKTNLEPKV